MAPSPIRRWSRSTAGHHPNAQHRHLARGGRGVLVAPDKTLLDSALFNVD